MKETIFTLDKIYRAYKQCRKRKKNTINALLFELDREKNLYNLCEELRTSTYKISRHIYFIVTKPTPREIFAADFRDRVVHHLLYHEIQAVFENDFITHSYANRMGKGTHKAVAQVRKFIQKAQVVGQRDVFYLQLDIQSFFSSINREILFSLLEDKINNEIYPNWWKKEILWLAKKIIFHDVTANYVYKGDPIKKKLIPPHKSLLGNTSEKGLPIGNLTSQFFANVYLNELDWFVTDKLGIDRYVRYVDDFVCVHSDKKTLFNCRKPIDDFLRERLKLQLHPQKVRLQTTAKGIDFLGYIIKKHHMLVRQKVVGRFKFLLERYDQLLVEVKNEEEKEKLLKSWSGKKASYFGHFIHANSYRLKAKFTSRLVNPTNL